MNKKQRTWRQSHKQLSEVKLWDLLSLDELHSHLQPKLQANNHQQIDNVGETVVSLLDKYITFLMDDLSDTTLQQNIQYTGDYCIGNYLIKISSCADQPCAELFFMPVASISVKLFFFLQEGQPTRYA